MRVKSIESLNAKRNMNYSERHHLGQTMLSIIEIVFGHNKINELIGLS